MNKIIVYRKTEEYRGLVSEVAHGVIEFRKKEGMLRIEWKYWLAETITSHPAYKKNSEGNQDFILNLAKDVNMELKKEEARLGRATVYNLLEVYEKYPSYEKAIKEIIVKGMNPYRWGSFLALIGRSQDSTEMESGKKCPKCGYEW